MESHASRKPSMSHEYTANGLLTSSSAQEKMLQRSAMFGFPGSSAGSSRSIG
jgi:hypothetical protein